MRLIPFVAVISSLVFITSAALQAAEPGRTRLNARETRAVNTDAYRAKQKLTAFFQAAEVTPPDAAPESVTPVDDSDSIDLLPVPDIGAAIAPAPMANADCHAQLLAILGDGFRTMESIRIAEPSKADVAFEQPPEGEDENFANAYPEDFDDKARKLLDCPIYMNYGVPLWVGCHPNRNTYPIRHNPLYFEDPNLERCGNGACILTTAWSASLFYLTLPTMPYRMTADCPCDLVCALPDCPTCYEYGWKAYVPEWDWKAAAVQGAATTGFVFLVP